MNTEPPFVKGLELNRGFYQDVVKPLLNKYFPELRFSASLLGYGSDVLGMDTAQSMDHNWGPRMQIFVDDKEAIPLIDERLREELPFEYRGFSVNFSDKSYDKTQRMEKTNKKPVNHLLEICRFEDYLKDRYRIDRTNNFSLRDWLAFTDQNLVELTHGEVFHDGLEKLNRMRAELKFYPPDICKLRMAVLWNYIWNKEAFAGRAIALDDFIGLKIIAGRLVNYLIKILFYLEGKYIPYSKWFGSAFKKLDAYEKAHTLAEEALSENNPKTIEEKLCSFYAFVVDRHNKTEGMPHLNNTIRDFFGRPYRDIFAESIVEALRNSICDEGIRSIDPDTYAFDIMRHRRLRRRRQ
jgi:hypothetical protein